MQSNILLVIEQFADQYKSKISKVHPELEIRIAMDIAEARHQIGDVDVLFGFGTSFDDELIRQAKRLKWLQFLSSGMDALARMPSLRAETIVTSTHGVHGPPVSEMVFLHMITLGRDYGRLRKNQDAARWEEFDQPLLYRKTVTILGTGLISQHLAQRCKAFGMRVVGVTATPRQMPFFDEVVHRSKLKAAASKADFLVLLIPLSPESRGIIDANILGVMKPSAYLINVARGPVCDEAALLAALREKRIAGAGMDAFCEEPLPPAHPFWSMENVTVTPHIAGRNDCYSDLVMPIILQNMRCFFENRRSEMMNVRRS